MKKRMHSRGVQEARRRIPDLRDEELIATLHTELDPREPREHVKATTVITRTELRVYHGEELFASFPMEKIARFEMIEGVGCVFAAYEGKDGEEMIFARADVRKKGEISAALKRANYFLRHGGDFLGSIRGKEKTCPRCGKPYPHGAHTCPRCASKIKGLTRLAGHAASEWKKIAISVVLFFLSTLVSIVIPMINREMVDSYVQNTEAARDQIFFIGFFGAVAAYFLAILLRRAIGVARGYFLAIAGNNLILRLRNLVFEKIQRLSIERISSHTAGELMVRVNSDTQQIKNFLVNQLPSLIEQFLLLVGVAAIMLTYDWRMALLILIPMPLVAFCFRMFWRMMRSLFHRRRQLSSDTTATLHDIFSGIRVVKSYGMEKREEERFVKMAGAERDAQLRLERIWAILMPILQFVLGFGEYVLLFYVGSQMLAGEMTAGEMSQFSAYTGMIFAPLMALMRFPRQFMMMMTSLTRVYEIMDEEVDVADGSATIGNKIEGVIDINHVSFGYDESREVLCDIDLHVRPGEFIGLVGKSGVGKSTLINLLMRMYDVDEGSITIDGVDVRDIPQEQLRSQMGVVLQESFLFTGSIWQNITYAKPNATREEVVRAAKAAGAHDFIIRLPDGYNTYVGERGHTLSGGERQRISIARALLHDPKILILDEATASLDTETEKLIQDALAQLAVGRTTIAIAHRLSTLRNATRLVVLDKGQIAEIGTHDELMERKGIYYGLVMAQREMSRIDG